MTDVHRLNARVRTTCPYCGVGCGVVAARDVEGQVAIQGDRLHPANYGRLCSKGAALSETLNLNGRLLYPEIAGKRCDWDTALDCVAEGFHRIIGTHGPEAVAFYVSGQLLTEDYYVANKLMKGFIGSGNIDTNSRLCMASAVAGHKRAFGSDTVPGCYEDLEQADLVVFAGSNAAWCHPVIFQRVLAARERNPRLKLVVIDPRRTATCEAADLHLPLKAGTDTLLWNGLLYHLWRRDKLDRAFINAHTEGFAEALRTARDSARLAGTVAGGCGLTSEAVVHFYELFERTEKVLSLYSQGVNQSSCGTDKVNAIINCHLATGRIGKPGRGPFSLTGQPNAMGGREVGALANQLAAHLEFENPGHMDLVRRFWAAPNIATKPGLKAIDLFQGIDAGKIKAVWIMATNPAMSLPDADRMRQALRRCELVVVSDCVCKTDTTECADMLLPALAWGEKDGTVTNSERRISRQRAFLPPPGEAQPDWWILCQVARRLGFGEAFDYQGPAEIFAEHAALSGFENDGSRDFDISALAALEEQAYQALEPFQWPLRKAQVRRAERGGGALRLFQDGQFFTPTQKARFIVIEPRAPRNLPTPQFPLVLNTGRVRDQWHSMTRTGKSPRLSAHIVEPYAELHPGEALRAGIQNGGLVRIKSPWGEIIVRARVTRTQRRGNVFVPMHWSDQWAGRARVDALVNPVTDPISGQPESKHTPVAIAAYRPAWHAFALTRQPLQVRHLNYWSYAAGRGFWRYELAGDHAPEDWALWSRALFRLEKTRAEWLEYEDRSAGCYRAARIVKRRLNACLFVGSSFELPPRNWLAGLFDKKALSAMERRQLLAGRPAGVVDEEKIVCACFGVGPNVIIDTIRRKGLSTLADIAVMLKTGTNCGSCIPELQCLLEKYGVRSPKRPKKMAN